VIAHWFAPPHIIPLVEVVKGPETAEETVATVVGLIEKVGHVPTVMEKFIPGFCINRLLRGYRAARCSTSWTTGTSRPSSSTWPSKRASFPGRWYSGSSSATTSRGSISPTTTCRNEAFVDAPVDNGPHTLVERVERGELGVKSGKGFFDYGGRSLEQVLHERDAAMLDVFGDVRDLIYKRI